MLRGWRQFVRTPAAEGAQELITKNLENRESNFLNLMRQVVFADETNPYRRLFAWARWSYADVERAVGREGLEATLENLREAGVCLSHDEFKGRKPVRRAGGQIAVTPSDFVNPLVHGGLEHRTSGSGGASLATLRSLEYQLYIEARLSLGFKQFATPGHAFIGLMPAPPGTAGIRWMAYLPRWGYQVDRWFAIGGSLRNTAHYRTLTSLLVLQARAAGFRMPFPTYLEENSFLPVALRIAEHKTAGVNTVLPSGVSRAVRVADAALENGLDIAGSTFLVGGEALTDAKRAIIEKTGSTVISRYGAVELGSIGWSCRQMTSGNCVHVFEDSLALINHRQQAPFSDVEVDSILFTTLLPFAPLVLVNVGMDDAGQLGPASCNCGWANIGMSRQAADVISYGKLSGQGASLVGSELLALLETALPTKFGGAPVDYQLVEREGSAQTEIELRVHPRLKIKSADDVKTFFLAEIKKLWGGSLAERWWTGTEGVHVVIAEPYLSGGYKVLPLHLLGTQSAAKPPAPARNR